MVLVSLSGQTDRFSKEIFRMIKYKVSANSLGLTRRFTKDNGMIIK
jgi:hypothetical protein